MKKLAKVNATIIVSVDDGFIPEMQATDALNEIFNDAEVNGVVVDWGYNEVNGRRVEILDLDPNNYKEGDAT